MKGRYTDVINTECEPKYEIKENCRFYRKSRKECAALIELYCKKENCKFYIDKRKGVKK